MCYGTPPPPLQSKALLRVFEKGAANVISLNGFDPSCTLQNVFLKGGGALLNMPL